MPSDATLLVGTVFTVAVGAAIFSAQTAALRGTKGKPFPVLLDKLCRLSFLCLLFLPVLAWGLLPRVPVLAAFVLYCPTYLDGSEKTGTRLSSWMRQWSLWWWFKRRLSLDLVVAETGDTKTGKASFDPAQKYIFGLHPHGILPWGGMINMCTDVSGAGQKLGIDVRVLAASFAFYIPGWRDMLIANGACDAARYCARALLEQHGKSLVLVPGGATEALHANPGRNTLVLRKRRGFVRLALQTGAALVPVYSFGENDTYSQFGAPVFDQGDGSGSTDPRPGCLDRMLGSVKIGFQAVFGISLPLIGNFLPHRCRVTTVVGAPIAVTKLAAGTTPTDEQINALLETYIEAVTALFDKHKVEALGEAFAEEKLVIL